MANYVYRNTIYASTITQLRTLSQSKIYTRVLKCPKEGCFAEVNSPYSLYKHIEQAHPEDKRHSSTYYK